MALSHLTLYQLLSGCGQSDAATRGLYAECLGMLGAIDPGRLELHSLRPKDNIKRLQVLYLCRSVSINDDFKI